MESSTLTRAPYSTPVDMHTRSAHPLCFSAMSAGNASARVRITPQSVSASRHAPACREAPRE
eukprot:228825-Pyramimonas_sp.AAC.1